MPVDTKEIKKALDSFENDEFVDAKETLAKEIKKAKNDFIKNKLDLKADIEPVKQEKSTEEE